MPQRYCVRLSKLLTALLALVLLAGAIKTNSELICKILPDPIQIFEQDLLLPVIGKLDHSVV
jgi:hypothetical protein